VARYNLFDLLPVGHIDPIEGTGVTQRKAGIFSVPSGDDVVVTIPLP